MILDTFEIVGNDDRKQWEFTPKTEGFTSYTVAYSEAATKADACIVVWKSIEAEKTRKPLTKEYLEANGFKFVDMMFSNDPMRYWRKDKLIIRKSDTGFAVDLFNDKEQHIEVEVNTVQKLKQLAELLGTSNKLASV
jgi:hypothetical protein